MGLRRLDAIKKPLVNGGFAIFTLLLVVGAILLLISLFFASSGAGEIRNTASSILKKKALGLNLACAEEALFQVYQGAGAVSGSVTIDDNTCNYGVTNPDVNGQRIITVSSNISGAVRKTKIIFKIINQKIRISSWKEVADF